MLRERVADGVDDFVAPLEDAVRVVGQFVPGVGRDHDERDDDERDGDERAARAPPEVDFQPLLDRQEVNARDDAEQQRHQHLADEHEEKNDGEQERHAVNQNALRVAQSEVTQTLRIPA